MYTRPSHVKKHTPEFKMPPKKTLGERWHEEVEHEKPLLTALTFALGILAVLAFVIVIGSQPGFGVQEADALTPSAKFHVTPKDHTNWQAKERMDHARLKKQAEKRKENLDAMKEADRIEAEAAAKQAELDAQTYEATGWEAADTGYYGYEPAVWDVSGSVGGDTGNLRYAGIESDGQYTYTWYSQNILPGNGLDIPGRHVGEGGYVMDGEDNIVVASSDLAKGTEVDTPYGPAKVYDTGCASGVLDVYTNW